MQLQFWQRCRTKNTSLLSNVFSFFYLAVDKRADCLVYPSGPRKKNCPLLSFSNISRSVDPMFFFDNHDRNEFCAYQLAGRFTCFLEARWTTEQENRYATNFSWTNKLLLNKRKIITARCQKKARRTVSCEIVFNLIRTVILSVQNCHDLQLF